ncbi:hypothetical protein RHGRI_019592 [Rhododendron griersonianum]|uniref:Methyltransferase n=1 Tax=Rhododendron griersonianum TaxID=479676 RepID=A0AAV6JFW3_9ERIC|nr:hypothetical protein RHGRI_019592 [Rhododendron griersonianum]
MAGINLLVDLNQSAIRKAVRNQQLEESLSTEDSEHGTRSIPITQEQEQNMIDNELRTTITAAGVTLGIDFEEEDVISVKEMKEGEVQEFARLQRNRRAKRRNSFTDVQAAMLTVLSAFQLQSFGGLRVLDVGCGIGGPLREIAQFSMTSVTGLNISEYQIIRAKALNRKVGLDKACDFVKADFMKMPFPDNGFDAVYALEATCHAADVVGSYKEIYRVLKPGQCFAAYEWCMTNSFDLHNQEHQKIKLKGLEYIGLAPKGSRRVHDFLEKAADGLVNGGR